MEQYMFTTDHLATIFIYVEYIVPLSIVLLIILYYIVSHYITKFKLYRLHKQHNIVQLYTDTYWYTYKCIDCGNIIYMQPSKVNFSLSSTDYIFKYTDKCTKLSKR